MNYWNQTPLFRVFPAFITGILFAIYVTLPEIKITIVSASILLTGLFFYVMFSRKLYRYKSRWIYGAAVYLLYFAAGWLLTGLHTEIIRHEHFSKLSPELFTGIIDEYPVVKEKSLKAIVRVGSIKNSKGCRLAEGKVLVYFKKSAASFDLKYGDQILFAQQPVEIPEPANPGQFDYKRYLRFHQVHHQVFLGDGKWKCIGKGHGNFLVEYAYRLRNQLLEVFKDNYIDGQDFAVLSALLLGYEDEIDSEIIRAYSVSGALHVLSVSGLHVGIIYLALNSLLFFMKKSRLLRLLKAVIIILFLWFYSLLTGLSPSVLRSAAMLSFVVIGVFMDRRTNMYNTLAASAILLLVIDPYIIMQVGFQLSYLAVLGIVFLYPKIYHIFFLKAWLLKQTWSMTAVSLAAQAATFPLGLFYFHQFPNYFIISNMLIIPLSTVIIYGGIFLLAMKPFVFLANCVGLIVGKLVHFLNAMVLKIETLPYALLEGISINVTETYLIYLFLLGLIFFVIHRRTMYLYPALIMVISLFGFNIRETIQLKSNRQFIVFHVPNQSAINFIDGNKSVLLADSSLCANETQQRFIMKQYWWERGVDVIKHVHAGTTSSNNSLYICNRLAKFYDKVIMRIDSGFHYSDQINFPAIDFLVLSGNAKVDLKQILNIVKPRQLIIDSSNSLYKAKQWIKVAEQSGIPVHSVLAQGAFVTTI